MVVKNQAIVQIEPIKFSEYQAVIKGSVSYCIHLYTLRSCPNKLPPLKRVIGIQKQHRNHVYLIVWASG